MQKFLATLSISLLLSFSPLAMAEEFMKVKHEIIDVIDGTTRCDSVKMLALERNIQNLRFGMNKGAQKLITHHGSKYTLRELVALERKARNAGNLDSFSKAHEETLLNAIVQFEAFSTPYLREAQGFKSQMGILIQAWAKQKNVTSLLTEWARQSQGQEMGQLKKLAITYKKFDEFLDHLSTFLWDVRLSCKNSWAEFSRKNIKK